jgi:hypothetical protein
VGEWVAFSDAQTGQLDKANGRTVDAIGIVERCEARDSASRRGLVSWSSRSRWRRIADSSSGLSGVIALED